MILVPRKRLLSPRRLQGGFILNPHRFAGPSGTPAVLSVTQTVFASDVNNHPVDMPATVNAGDLLLLGITMRSSSGDLTSAVTTPSGWTKIGQEISGSGTPLTTQYALFYKFAGGSEGGTTVNVAVSVACHAAAQVHRVANVSALNARITGQPSTMTVTVLNHNSGNSNLKAWVVGFGSNGTASPSSYPTAVYPDNNTTTASGGTNACRVISATGVNTNATSLATGDFSMASPTNSARFAVALW